MIGQQVVAAVLCRAFANTLLENKPKLDALGVKTVGIVKVQYSSAPVLSRSWQGSTSAATVGAGFHLPKAHWRNFSVQLG